MMERHVCMATEARIETGEVLMYLFAAANKDAEMRPIEEIREEVNQLFDRGEYQDAISLLEAAHASQTFEQQQRAFHQWLTETQPILEQFHIASFPPEVLAQMVTEFRVATAGITVPEETMAETKKPLLRPFNEESIRRMRTLFMLEIDDDYEQGSRYRRGTDITHIVNNLYTAEEIKKKSVPGIITLALTSKNALKQRLIKHFADQVHTPLSQIDASQLPRQEALFIEFVQDLQSVETYQNLTPNELVLKMYGKRRRHDVVE
jgi:hypothetical protein